MGPENVFSQHLHATKYRPDGELFEGYCRRYASTLADSVEDYEALFDGIYHQRILPAGRQQLAVGRDQKTTAYNCTVGGTIHDSMEGIMDELKNAALTLRAGAGCGWDFSTLRPSNDAVRGLGEGAFSSGPVSFMGLWDSLCFTIHSAGYRRGAMMGVMRCDHPDIEHFIHAKRNAHALTNFNISVTITDEFMDAVKNDKLFPLQFGGRIYREVRALDLWEMIMENNWHWGEPGVLFIDRINQMNPLSYCETIHATNPCSEQPLPPFGACLLGSLNLAKYVVGSDNTVTNISSGRFDYDLYLRDIRSAVRAFDNVTDRTNYPLKAQKVEAQSKRRMGVGITGMANALEILGFRYGTEPYLRMQGEILETLRDTAYMSSIELAREKGSFELFDADKWLSSGFAQTLPEDIRHDIKKDGLRNGLLLSIAPTGTISLTADNISSGIEPPFALTSNRIVKMPEGEIEITLNDYAYDKYGVEGKTAGEVTAEEHVKVLCAAQKYIDSAVSKTCNVDGGDGEGQVSFSDFKELYMMAYDGGAKGCATFNKNGLRGGILSEAEGEACYINPETGVKTCE